MKLLRSRPILLYIVCQDILCIYNLNYTKIICFLSTLYTLQIGEIQILVFIYFSIFIFCNRSSDKEEDFTIIKEIKGWIGTKTLKRLSSVIFQNLRYCITLQKTTSLLKEQILNGQSGS
jgi:hypothetical protein